ncbi:MAG: 16S rRNA (guanine(966)-N(2))-methyltransferase RsmD [Patescibacteria group bacterium]
MIRVTSGTAKGKKLELPNVEGIKSPQDVFKLAVFSIIGEKVQNAQCLDLFAGSGAFGIEALSRGAAHCIFVDQNYDAIGTIMKNLELCEFTEKATLFKKPAVKYAQKYLEQINEQNAPKLDLIFMDPFFEDTKQTHLLKILALILKQDGLIFYSHSKDTDPTEILEGTNLHSIEQRRYNNAALTILERIKND